MKVNDSVDYLFDKAVDEGYDRLFLEAIRFEIHEIVNTVEDCSIEVLDRLYEELF